jgi:hypothetical protein
MVPVPIPEGASGTGTNRFAHRGRRAFRSLCRGIESSIFGTSRALGGCVGACSRGLRRDRLVCCLSHRWFLSVGGGWVGPQPDGLRGKTKNAPQPIRAEVLSARNKRDRREAGQVAINRLSVA